MREHHIRAFIITMAVAVGSLWRLITFHISYFTIDRMRNGYLFLWLCQASLLAQTISSFSVIFMGTPRGKGKLQRTLDNSITQENKTTNKVQELTGVTLPEEGNN